MCSFWETMASKYLSQEAPQRSSAELDVTIAWKTTQKPCSCAQMLQIEQHWASAALPREDRATQQLQNIADATGKVLKLRIKIDVTHWGSTIPGGALISCDSRKGLRESCWCQGWDQVSWGRRRLHHSQSRQLVRHFGSSEDWCTPTEPPLQGGYCSRKYGPRVGAPICRDLSRAHADKSRTAKALADLHGWFERRRRCAHSRWCNKVGRLRWGWLGL